jgi:hypothetical protein
LELYENDEVVNFIKSILRGLKKHGIKRIVKALKDVDLNTENINYLIVIDFIEKSICDRLKVEVIALYDKQTRGDITIARKLCVLFLRKHLDMSDETIGAHYHRTRQLYHMTHKEYQALNPTNKTDANFINLYNEFDTKIQDYIASVKNQKD